MEKSRFLSQQVFKQKYNDLYHNVDLYLDNTGNFETIKSSPKRYHINPAAVINLQITDTVNDWVVAGELTFLYLTQPPKSVQESKTGQPKQTNITEEAAIKNGQMLDTFQFRGDGFDILRVMVVPQSTLSTESSIQIDEQDSRWHLSYLFAIYDIEDINNFPTLDGNSSTYMKCLKLKFHDVRYQMLRTSNIEYSSSLPKNKNLTPKFDTDIAKELGVLPTGEIIKDIFNEVLANPDNGGCEEFKIVPGHDWDPGKSEMFYTSPAQFSAEEDVEYVLGHHLSKKELKLDPEFSDNIAYDLCLLHTDRPDQYGSIEPLALTPLVNFFEQAGKEASKPGNLQKEHFFLTHLSQEEGELKAGFKAPVSSSSSETVDFKTAKYGQITSYSFVDMAAETNSEMFRTTPVYSIDIKKREFNVEFKSNSAKYAKNAISRNYISNLFKQKDVDEQKLFLPTQHVHKETFNVFPTFSLNGTNKHVRQKNGFHHLLYTGLFQNACIKFKTLGLTWRESGTFIGIDKTEGSVNDDYFNKVCGQWFVVQVDHVFESQSYVNIIYAVKLHRFDELKIKFENSIS